MHFQAKNNSVFDNGVGIYIENIARVVISYDIYTTSHQTQNEAYEPRRENTCLPCFRLGLKQTGLHNYKRWLEA